MMRVVEEMSTAETAAVLNLTQNVVKTRLRRARALLREKLHAAVGALGREAFRFAGRGAGGCGWRKYFQRSRFSEGRKAAAAREPDRPPDREGTAFPLILRIRRRPQRQSSTFRPETNPRRNRGP
jgi:hypothetical protein